MLQKLRNMIGIDEAQYDEDYEEYYSDEIGINESGYPDSYLHGQSEQEKQEPEGYRGDRRTSKKRQGETMTKSNVIGMPGLANGISEVIVIEPHSFEEMPQVIQALRERKSVVLNLNVMNPEEAQRAVDFVAGGTYAMDGHQERVGESIFLFTPSCVKVSTLSGIIHDVDDIPEGRARPSTATVDPWGEAAVMAQ
ncbi:cell division protein SepF [Pleurocapsales cyanobacterium LEGE 06147]|nr:cell division protein SepF [Pleurocapsales cyanobacterium LEGE 06147]